MNSCEIASKMVDILSKLSGTDNIENHHKLQEDLGLDSLGLVSLLVSIEEEFDITLDASDMNPFDLVYVSDAINLVEKYISPSVKT